MRERGKAFMDAGIDALDPTEARKPFYAHLYVQVLIAIAAGVAVGHFYPSTGEALKPLGDVSVTINRANGTSETITVLCRIDTAGELDYYKSGGVLHYVLRTLAA